MALSPALPQESHKAVGDRSGGECVKNTHEAEEGLEKGWSLPQKHTMILKKNK